MKHLIEYETSAVQTTAQRSGEEEFRDSLLKFTREKRQHSQAELAEAARRWESRIIFRIKMEEQRGKAEIGKAESRNCKRDHWTTDNETMGKS